MSKLPNGTLQTLQTLPSSFHAELPHIQTIPRSQQCFYYLSKLLDDTLQTLRSSSMLSYPTQTASSNPQTTPTQPTMLFCVSETSGWREAPGLIPKAPGKVMTCALRKTLFKVHLHQGSGPLLWQFWA